MYISVSMRKWILSSKKILAYIHLFPIPKDFRVLLMAQQVKNPPAMQGDSGLTPGLGRSPGGGNGILLQYSYLKNPTDRGAWWATVHSVSRVAHDWATKQAKQSISRTRVVISGLLKFVNSLSAPETVFFHINYASHVLISRSNSDTSFAGTTQWEHSDSALLRLWHSLLSSCLHEPTCLGSDPLEQSVLQHGHSLHPARPLTPPCYPCMKALLTVLGSNTPCSAAPPSPTQILAPLSGALFPKLLSIQHEYSLCSASLMTVDYRGREGFTDECNRIHSLNLCYKCTPKL